MKNLMKSKRAEGFTIIEVMIVLAIAGLIMVVVFIAVPQLQRNQRDNARQSIADRVKAEIETYAGNNTGVYPFGTTTSYEGTACTNNVTGCWKNFYANYIQNKVKINDPSTGQDVFDGNIGTTCGGSNSGLCPYSANVKPPQSAGVFEVVFGAKCDGENIAQSSPTANLQVRTYAVLIGLDRSNTDYCVDNG